MRSELVGWTEESQESWSQLQAEAVEDRFRMSCFEPGDGTRYVVVARPVPVVSRQAGVDGQFFFGFGTGSGPLRAWTFPARDVSYGYYVEKMMHPGEDISRVNEWTLFAGWLVLRAFLGLPLPSEPAATPRTLHWGRYWWTQLGLPGDPWPAVWDDAKRQGDTDER